MVGIGLTIALFLILDEKIFALFLDILVLQ